MADCTLHRHCTLQSFLLCLLSFSVCPQTDTAQLHNTQSDPCMRTPPLDRIIVIFMTSHMVVDTSLDFLHGSRAQFGETAGPSRPQVHKGLSAMESAYVRDCRCSQVHSEYEYGESVVDMHVPPIKGTAK